MFWKRKYTTVTIWDPERLFDVVVPENTQEIAIQDPREIRLDGKKSHLWHIYRRSDDTNFILIQTKIA